eukprot:555525_1
MVQIKCVDQLYCDSCNNVIPLNTLVYHCGKQNNIHPYGYDICEKLTCVHFIQARHYLKSAQQYFSQDLGFSLTLFQHAAGHFKHSLNYETNTKRCGFLTKCIVKAEVVQFQVIDHLLGKYYQQFEINNYFDKQKNGLFMQYVLNNKLLNLSIEDQLGPDCNADQCLYIDGLIHTFPFHHSISLTDDTQRKTVIFHVLKFCFKEHIFPTLFEMKQYNSEECKEDAHISCRKQSNACKSVERLIAAIEVYKLFYVNITNDQIEKMNVELILNDFCHFIEFHSHEHEQFEFITNTVKTCDIVNCQIFKRNFRNREEVNNHTLYGPKNIQTEDVARYQIMDKIHCYCIHPFESSNTMFEKHESKHEDSNELGINVEVKKRSKLIQQRYQTINQIMNVGERSSKFSQLEFSNQERQMFSFGQKFYYGYYDEIAVGMWHMMKVKSKYKSLKEEVTMNKICIITVEQFNNVWQKASLHFNSYYRKKMYSSIRIDWLLALMIYANHTLLQCEFSKTYRDNVNEHNNFYYLGKFLKISVHEFGEEIQSGRITSFYHGISENLQFPSCICDEVTVYCPLSTSSSIEVAMNFANQGNGLVVEFNNKNSHEYYFSLSWLSDYPNENEHLFIQSESQLNMVNIVDVKSGLEYKPILDNLNNIENIFNFFKKKKKK